MLNSFIMFRLVNVQMLNSFITFRLVNVQMLNSAAGRSMSMTPSGTELANFRVVAQCLNQLRHRIPLIDIIGCDIAKCLLPTF